MSIQLANFIKKNVSKILTKIRFFVVLPFHFDSFQTKIEM